MRLLSTRQFQRCYQRLPAEIQDRVDQKLELLLANPRHPSLQIKKMRGLVDVWELRVTQGYRLTFQTDKDLYVLRRVGAHDILRSP